MSNDNSEQLLARAFARLSQGAARRKIYSRKAAREDRPGVARLLRAIAASENAQARRLFNSLIGRIDKSPEYLTTIFEQELTNILENYAKLHDSIPDNRPALHHAVSQLQAAAKRLQSFYDRNSRDVNVAEDTRYFVCRFCGYVSTEGAPEKCPICAAPRDAFHEVE